jgi:transaldolase
MNATQKLHAAGQSIWYDNIQRGLLNNGGLAGMIQRGEIRGVTSNPTIFMNAIAKSTDYDDQLQELAAQGAPVETIYADLTVRDIQAAADLFLPLYRETNRGDGYVSLEVSPTLAHDSERTLEEARRLWQRVDRPNLMVKIPATKAGLPAITAAIADGINVNVTLIFSRQRYAEVMDAYLSGLEQRAASELPVDTIASVASFFVSRVDTAVDRLLGGIAAGDGPRAETARAITGKTGIANARLAYADFKKVFGSPRFQALRAKGARVQRPLWASTGTKNPQYSDVLYVEELIGPDTVDTVPPQTLAAFLDHGTVPQGSLEKDLGAAEQLMADLKTLGISYAGVTQQLEDEGVKSFADAYTDLLATIEQRREQCLLEKGSAR